MSKEIKKWPFCGSYAVEVDEGCHPFYYVQCIECLATTASAKGIDGALKLWNNRAKDSK